MPKKAQTTPSENLRPLHRAQLFTKNFGRVALSSYAVAVRNVIDDLALNPNAEIVVPTLKAVPAENGLARFRGKVAGKDLTIDVGTPETAVMIARFMLTDKLSYLETEEIMKSALAPNAPADAKIKTLLFAFEYGPARLTSPSFNAMLATGLVLLGAPTPKKLPVTLAHPQLVRFIVDKAGESTRESLTEAIERAQSIRHAKLNGASKG